MGSALWGQGEPIQALANDQGHLMNKDPINGPLKSPGGKVQGPAGKAAGSAAQKAKGTVREHERKLRAAYDNVKEILKNSRHS
jgi:uncharacterized protein YjbJ (UPF0337 family)